MSEDNQAERQRPTDHVRAAFSAYIDAVERAFRDDVIDTARNVDDALDALDREVWDYRAQRTSRILQRLARQEAVTRGAK